MIGEFILLVFSLLTISPFYIALAGLLWWGKRKFPNCLECRFLAIWGHKYLVNTFLFSILIFISCLFLYTVSIAIGYLPNPNDWTANHGPWRRNIEGLIINTSLFMYIDRIRNKFYSNWFYSIS